MIQTINLRKNKTFYLRTNTEMFLVSLTGDNGIKGIKIPGTALENQLFLFLFYRHTVTSGFVDYTPILNIFSGQKNLS